MGPRVSLRPRLLYHRARDVILSIRSLVNINFSLTTTMLEDLFSQYLLLERS